MRPADQDCHIEHASAVALAGHALIITGPSGSGKSTLSLELLALGADLVADDRCCLWVEGGHLMADAPQAIRGRIEARNLGILNAVAVGPAQVAAYVDLSVYEDQRLPSQRTTTVLGVTVPLVQNVDGPHFVPALIQFLKAGRWA
ncbi:HPr kinase/phosphorylase [Thalassobius sp. Cn5-15]|uniref:HPr kinase/phosphorylase n=1 Tax=Thalassobius sp. Cn5-15 TaxID=2917763 RepID=UPI001EF1678F|nr:HPr kinase/phosphatase C-terminal domain-containing protein [Thalassobius sp. Cn5-15]MCG7493770.1 HPr kinase/phosphatase C-terminal domain-containing protein [Thalassobius sp. Cn5-15]